jgi:hypothetical protein
MPGRICDAKPLSLFMPGSKYQPTALVVSPEEGLLEAVVLDGQHQFVVFECSTNKAWHGMLIHDVSVEIDEKSLFDLDRFDPPLGALTRKSDVLSIAAMPHDGFRTIRRIDLIRGLPTTGEDVQVGFTRWRIVVGIGMDKRELFVVDRPIPKSD